MFSDKNEYSLVVIIIFALFIGGSDRGALCGWPPAGKPRTDNALFASILPVDSGSGGTGGGHDQHSCPRCALHRQSLENALSEAELANSRIEYIKQQILKKLRLREPPSIKRRASVPSNAFRADIVPGVKQEDEFEEEMDDFYGKTGRIVVFPVKEENECPSRSKNGDAPIDCSTYELPVQLEDEHVASAVLWIHVTPRSRSGHSDLENEAMLEVNIDSKIHKEYAHSYQNSSLNDGWVQIDLAAHVQNWLEKDDLRHHIVTSCRNCGPNVKISDDPETRPFLILNTEPMNRTRRLKRNVSCAPGIKECCREGLYLSFKDIGWSNWIIWPSGYQAYFCKGSCSEATSLTVSGSHYTTIVQRLIHTTPRTQNLGLVPCCTATKLSSMTLLYMDKDNTMTEKIIPNMIVESCGCM